MRESWLKVTLGEVTSRITQRNRIGNGNVLTISAQYGLVSQEEFFQRRVASTDTRQYYLLHHGDFAYNKSYSDGYPAGVVRRLDQYKAGVVSPLYICFRPDSERIDSNFLSHYFEAGLLDKEILWIAKEGVRNHGLLNVKVGDFFSLPIRLPPLAEQRWIAEILDALDEQITAISTAAAKRKVLIGSFIEDALASEKDAAVVTLGSLLTRIDAGWSPLCDERPPTPGQWGVLKVSAVTSGRYDPAESKTLLSGMTPRPHLEVRKGDILMARANGVKQLVGVTAYVDVTPIRLMLSDKTMRLVPDRSRLEPQFIDLLCNARSVRRQVDALLSGGSGQNNISQEFVRSLRVPNMTISEQCKLVATVNAVRHSVNRMHLERAKLQRLKLGLMDDLLTGRIRVPAGTEALAEV